MKAILTAVALLSMAQAVNAQYRAEYKSYTSNDVFTATITSSALSTTPDWNANDANPPLPIRDALFAGQTLMAQLLTDGSQWPLKEITLIPAYDQKWYFKLTYYEPKPVNDFNGPVRHFDVFVLMNGHAVVPERQNNIPNQRFEGTAVPRTVQPSPQP
ncbi:MAG: hypothetical protein M5U15_15335 [Kiritimatiellae bacterium]|nr:hypothetical protein [Kiritimatiellia bacterium]